MNQLEQLRLMTTTVADTGELHEIKKYKPTDSTTNPSLVLRALQALEKKEQEWKKNNDVNENKENRDANHVNEYDELISIAIDYANKYVKDHNNLKLLLSVACDRLACEFGYRILKEIPGYVSTELDARLSFDIEGSVERALHIMNIYENIGLENPKSRVLIKVASTWEGVQIAKILQSKYDIKCNLTLLFNVWQAAAASQIANAYLISPFVGRITDWHQQTQKVSGFDAFKNDPGVLSVKDIYSYLKMTESKTIVMGASFRNKNQVLALAGCDRLTIGPKFLQELQDSTEQIQRQLSPDNIKSPFDKPLEIDEKTFRWNLNEDAMATEKLAEGIRIFAADTVKLENILKPYFTNKKNCD